MVVNTGPDQLVEPIAFPVDLNPIELIMNRRTWARTHKTTKNR